MSNLDWTVLGIAGDLLKLLLILVVVWLCYQWAISSKVDGDSVADHHDRQDS